MSQIFKLPTVSELTSTQPKMDEYVDLNFHFSKEKISPFHTEEYLNSFQHMALSWDPNSKSENMSLEFDQTRGDGGTVRCLTSLNSFKTVYSQETLY